MNASRVWGRANDAGFLHTEDLPQFEYTKEMTTSSSSLCSSLSSSTA